MLWYKNWLECRFRVWLCYGLALFVLACSLISVVPLAVKQKPLGEGLGSRWAAATWTIPATPPEQTFWTMFLDLFAGVLLPISALILAGSGINTQTNWGMTHGFHPSMEFMLSLPVTRSRLYWARVAMGALFTAALAPLVTAAVLVIVPLNGVPLNPMIGLQLMPYLLVGTALYYAFGVLLSSWLDEFWGGMVGLTLIGMISGYSFAGGPGWIAVVSYMEGRHLFAHGQAGWLQGLAYAGIAAAMLGAGHRIISRKEY